MSVALIVTLTFLLAGLVKGVIGLGLPTVAVGLLTLVMKPAQAAALLVVPSLVTNIWQLLAGPRFGALLRRLSGMMLGIALMIYAAAGLATLRLAVPPRAERLLSPLVGATTGLVSAATGVFVLPAAPYLQALGLDREDLVQALGLSFTVSTLALAVVLARDGALELSNAGASLLALAPALGGMFLGQWLRVRASPRVFRICFFAGLLVLGAHLALRAVL